MIYIYISWLDCWLCTLGIDEQYDWGFRFVLRVLYFTNWIWSTFALFQFPVNFFFGWRGFLACSEPMCWHTLSGVRVCSSNSGLCFTWSRLFAQTCHRERERMKSIFIEPSVICLPPLILRHGVVTCHKSSGLFFLFYFIMQSAEWNIFFLSFSYVFSCFLSSVS